METIHWVLLIAIVSVLILLVLMFQFFQAKFAKTTNRLDTHQGNIRLLLMYFAFMMEQDFRKKVELLNKLLSRDDLYTISFLIDVKIFKRHLQQILAENLLQQIHRKDIVKAVKLIDQELHSAWPIYVEGNNIPMIMAEKTDFGFLETLYDAYGAETDEEAFYVLTVAHRDFTPFKDNYLKHHNTVANNFGHLFKEFEKRKDTALREIVREWICRGGNPTAAMYRNLETALDTGYSDDDKT